MAAERIIPEKAKQVNLQNCNEERVAFNLYRGIHMMNNEDLEI